MHSVLPIPHRFLAAFLALMLPVCCCSVRITADMLGSDGTTTALQSCCGGGCGENSSEDAPAPDCGDSGCGCCLKSPNTGQTTIDLSQLGVLCELHPVAEGFHDADHDTGLIQAAGGLSSHSVADAQPDASARRLRATIILQV